MGATRWPAVAAIVTMCFVVLTAPTAMPQGNGRAWTTTPPHGNGSHFGQPGPQASGVRFNPHRLPRITLPQPARTTYDRAAARALYTHMARDRHSRAALNSFRPPTLTFPSLSYCAGGYCHNPPDGGLAAGPSSVLVAVNSAIALYSRTGQLLLGPVTFGDFFGTGSYSAYDPRARYDAGNAAPGGYNGGHGRFILVTVTTETNPQLSTYNIAVSQNENPQSASTGWCHYRIAGGVISGTVPAFADFPEVGMDGSNIYLTSEELTYAAPYNFVYHRLLVIPKASIYPDAATGACPTLTSTDFRPLTNPDGSLAVDVEPANEPDALPGQSDPMYFVNSIEAGGSQVAVRSVTTSPSLQLNAPSWVNVAPYDQPPYVPQPGGVQVITSGTSLQEAMYRYGYIWASNSTRHVSPSLSSSPDAYSNVQWYKIDPVALSAESHAITNPNVAFFTSNMAVGCNVPTTDGNCANPFIGLELTGLGPKHPLTSFFVLGNGLPTLLKQGVFGYGTGGSFTLWGDYPGASTDPTTPTEVWIMGEYAQTTTSWGTTVAMIGPPTLALTPETGTYTQSASVTGTNFTAGERVNLYLDSTSTTPLISTTARADDSFVTTVPVPRTPYGSHTVIAIGQTSALSATASFDMQPRVVPHYAVVHAGMSDGLRADGFAANEAVTARWGAANGPVLGSSTTNSVGSLYPSHQINFTVPSDPPGQYAIYTIGASSGAAAVTPIQIIPSW